MSQSSTTAVTAGPFSTTSNGTTSLPSTSPAGNQNQFNDVMKGRLAPSPSAFGLQQSNATAQVNSNAAGGVRLPSSGSESITTPHTVAIGPTSVNSSRGPSPAPATPVVSSPATTASLGKCFVFLVLETIFFVRPLLLYSISCFPIFYLIYIFLNLVVQYEFNIFSGQSNALYKM